MGNISFLTGGDGGSPQSLNETIYQLENTSVIFVAAWQKTPKDLHRASQESKKAMAHLDHIVNEILRTRDHLKAIGVYIGSELELKLNVVRATSSGPVTRDQQLFLPQLGPGNGSLPSPGMPITMEKLLNKIKHRRYDAANFRIGPSGEHIFIIAVDTPKQKPDSIVEFVIGDFCTHCNSISQHV